jgi:hypothetical protein
MPLILHPQRNVIYRRNSGGSGVNQDFNGANNTALTTLGYGLLYGARPSLILDGSGNAKVPVELLAGNTYTPAIASPAQWAEVVFSAAVVNPPTADFQVDVYVRNGPPTNNIAGYSISAVTQFGAPNYQLNLNKNEVTKVSVNSPTIPVWVANTDYTLRIEALGDIVRCYANGVKYIDWTDPAPGTPGNYCSIGIDVLNSGGAAGIVLRSHKAGML